MTSFALEIRITLTLCFMVLLVIASLTPGKSGPGNRVIGWLVEKTPARMQKVLHVCLYAVLVLLLVWTLGAIQTESYRFLTAFVIAVVFGAVMEWCQTKVPGRFGTLSDVALNAAGAALGLLVAALLM